MMNKSEITNYLLKNEVKPSLQRLNIYQYLIEKKNHPTVDKIYQDLIHDIPTLSKTTIYNTLKLFVDKGVVMIVNIENNEVRYDADTSSHGHFKCEKCKKIYDIKIDISKLNLIHLENHTIKEAHLYFKGICENCKKQKLNNN